MCTTEKNRPVIKHYVDNVMIHTANPHIDETGTLFIRKNCWAVKTKTSLCVLINVSLFLCCFLYLFENAGWTVLGQVSNLFEMCRLEVVLPCKYEFYLNVAMSSQNRSLSDVSAQTCPLLCLICFNKKCRLLFHTGCWHHIYESTLLLSLVVLQEY